MGTDAEQSWWEEHNDRIRQVHETGFGENLSLLSHEICNLLTDVDAAFTITGADTPGWADPHIAGVAPDEAEYGRCPNPEKFLIVVARAQAWTKVLLNRGWARETSDVDWAFRPTVPDGAVTILEPAAEGAVPLVLTTHTRVDSDHLVNVRIAAGNPAVSLASIPHCECDACDDGSDALLEDLDQWVLSVVDGSLHAEITADRFITRTSFGAHGGSVQNLGKPTAFTAGPWPPDWTPRTLSPGFEMQPPRAPFPRSTVGVIVRRLLRRP
ncbi:hypothetical protein IEU95_08500 [Hoyosella rhizosphaerae]|uniref:Uncharacterized protein n=1 Tax=Hoyosella rhizosphaerae TaxID=1755582 RepID=A0A916U0R6_9ACTN|nr:DUF6226 family protein [Hoyosella rhizosphaerae]MBN4926868.1 hypothetical protein [Hoyosella rhizosphaerae]GGC55893.1 hypothetical protein GCM10011410_05360 [Hoyosella rhizosphaerae]